MVQPPLDQISRITLVPAVRSRVEHAVPAVIAVPGIGAEFDELPDDVEPPRPDRDPERYVAARVGRVDDARA